MDAHEVARRASALPSRFAARVPPETLAGLRLMGEGGEFGELTLELTAALAATRTRVSVAEREELRLLLSAMHLPTVPADQLEVLD